MRKETVEEEKISHLLLGVFLNGILKVSIGRDDHLISSMDVV